MKKLKLYLFIFTVSSSVILLNFMILPKEETGGKKLFQDFISQFDKTQLPHKIIVPDDKGLKKNTVQLETISSQKLITQKFKAFIPGLIRSKYTRGPITKYYFKNIVYENEDFVIVTYGLQSGYITKSIDECALASYSKKARTINANRLLSVITVARNHRYESIESVIGEDLMIKSIIYETIRNDDEREKSGKAITKKYKITEDGKITIM